MLCCIYNTIFCKKFTNSKITLDNGEYLWYNSDTSNGVYFFVPIFKMDAKIITPVYNLQFRRRGRQ